jgi:hypothetical protein
MSERSEQGGRSMRAFDVRVLNAPFAATSRMAMPLVDMSSIDPADSAEYMRLFDLAADRAK